MPPVQRREIASWSLYDFANSAFSTLIVTFVFNRYFVEFVVGDPLRGTILWTRAVNISAITVALLMPFLGAIADHSGRKKRFLFLFTALAVACTVLLFFSQPGDVLFAAAVFVVANVAGEGAQVFYNGFLPELSDRKTLGRISGFAWGLGYFGGLLSLLLGLAIYEGVIPVPETDYLNIRVSTLLVAAWFALFSAPMFLWVRERAERRSATAGEYAAIGFRRVGETFRQLGTFREAAKLLLARLLYNDGLTTLVGPRRNWRSDPAWRRALALLRHMDSRARRPLPSRAVSSEWRPGGWRPCTFHRALLSGRLRRLGAGF